MNVTRAITRTQTHVDHTSSGCVINCMHEEKVKLCHFIYLGGSKPYFTITRSKIIWIEVVIESYLDGNLDNFYQVKQSIAVENCRTNSSGIPVFVQAQDCMHDDVVCHVLRLSTFSNSFLVYCIPKNIQKQNNNRKNRNLERFIGEKSQKF